MPFPFAAAAAVGTTVFSGIGAKRRQREQNEANRNLARQQASWNLQQWDRQNAYNTPQAQMDRYREAGLNPNLIYGTGTASAGLADAVKGYDRAEAVGVENNLETLGRYQGGYMNQVKTDNIKAQTEVAHQDRVNKSLQALGITFDNRSKAVKAGIGERTADYFVEAQEYQTAQAYERQEGLHLDNQQKEAMNPQILENLKGQLKLIKAQTSSIAKQDALRALELKFSAKGMAQQFLEYVKNDPMLNAIYNNYNKVPQ